MLPAPTAVKYAEARCGREVEIKVMRDRTNLLINCSEEEAYEIGKRARLQRRSISGYVRKVVMRTADSDEMFLGRIGCSSAAPAKNPSAYGESPAQETRP